MAIPIVYNLRSVKARWTSSIVAVLGIAGTVGVFVAMLSLARGFRATLISSAQAAPYQALRMNMAVSSCCAFDRACSTVALSASRRALLRR